MKKNIFFMLLAGIVVIVLGMNWRKCQSQEKQSIGADGIFEVSQNQYVSVGNNEMNEVVGVAQDKKIVKNITMSFDYDLVLPTLDDLKKEAPYIFEGILKETDSYVSSSAGGTIETNYYYEVTKVFKGDLQTGEEVKVNSLGGQVSCEEYFAGVDKLSAADEKLAKQKNAYVESLVEGAPMPEVGKKYILFTGYFNGAHNVLGMTQGLFYPEENGSFYRYYPEGLNEKEKIKGIKVQDKKLKVLD